MSMCTGAADHAHAKPSTHRTEARTHHKVLDRGRRDRVLRDRVQVLVWSEHGDARGGACRGAPLLLPPVSRREAVGDVADDDDRRRDCRQVDGGASLVGLHALATHLALLWLVWMGWGGVREPTAHYGRNLTRGKRKRLGSTV